MFRSILTPLDGSPFAEQALPLALSIARRARARLDLLHVHVLYALTDPRPSRYTYDANEDAEHRQQEQLYLDGTAKWLAAVSPVPTSTVVVSGTGTEGILERAGSSRHDLVVMATHGRSRVARFFLGSVADELVRQAEIPVLLVPTRDPAPTILPEPVLENVLVALDGSALAERVLGPALDLVRLVQGRCSLLRIAEVGQEIEARAYLETISRRLRDEGIVVETRVIVASHAAEAILEQADKRHGDVIALATHGRGGLRRMLLGSVADEVIRGAAAPILVYRPPEEV